MATGLAECLGETTTNAAQLQDELPS